jgi:hypothetical protein
LLRVIFLFYSPGCVPVEVRESPEIIKLVNHQGIFQCDSTTFRQYSVPSHTKTSPGTVRYSHLLAYPNGIERWVAPILTAQVLSS